jgi:hypothetical protein
MVDLTSAYKTKEAANIFVINHFLTIGGAT